jgi:hypothetical protein
MHEYLGPIRQSYQTCKDCGKRTPHVCIKCGYCYSCHPKVEMKVKVRQQKLVLIA